ncbi:MAG: outer membrane lipoprotein carrier protein LolA [Bacteroidales bacterium]|nr:outer membrane lipoprotein carrier protein LolA [Bacteroidales bacterium]MDD2280157.1 outer membrane lipoprotein carrier protein LolA [Bacteroidales bacterium]MDD4292894.1 outer membrane lipoprotein carrier protein LolA [Bacteroidales bacterium]MDD4491775.1 outer membrane lipoprotein carrier protein LolA [Bacteroidales bacterium]HPS95799.1 outer membrane lipoprotein carrier protein LolA [Bacteroidales bacterium]
MRLVTYLLFFTILNSGFRPIPGNVSNPANISSAEEDFYSALAKRSKDISTVTADFVQSKHITVLNETVVSKGSFYYKKSGNVRFDYTSPKVMSIVMNSVKLHLISSGKTTTFQLENQKGLSDLARVMEACIGGDINSIPKSYRVSYLFLSNRHKLIIAPKNKEILGPYSKIELFLNETDYSLDEMVLYEKSNDFTTYKFSNLILNRSLSGKMFLL